jgi:hypothetical protein
VNSFLQVTNVNPLNEEDSKFKIVKVYSNIFSIGDVCLSRANEPKAVVPLYTYVPILVNNLKVLLSENESTNGGQL